MMIVFRQNVGFYLMKKNFPNLDPKKVQYYVQYHTGFKLRFEEKVIDGEDAVLFNCE